MTMNWPTYELVAAGGCPRRKIRPGDFILFHRHGFASALIRFGERLRMRPRYARWSHVAHVRSITHADDPVLVEALTRGVVRTRLSDHEGQEYVVVHTSDVLWGEDVGQANSYIDACVGDRYGWVTCLSILLRFVVPGRGGAVVGDNIRICSGLEAEALTRGWAIFPHVPASMSPGELAEFYGVLA